MTPTAEDVLNAALNLPDEDRLEVVEALIGTFRAPDRPPCDESWREVISRRSTELHSGSVTPIRWAEVKRRAREAAGHARR